MLYQAAELRAQLNKLADALITGIAFTAALAIRRLLNLWYPEVFPPFDALWQHAWLYLLIVPLWLFLLELNGYYRHPFARTPWGTLAVLARVNLLGIVATFFLLYLLKVKHIPRVLIVIFGFLDVFALWFKDLVARFVLPKWVMASNVLLVGPMDQVLETFKELREQPAWLVRVVGVVPLDSQDSSTAKISADAPPVLGSLQDLVKILHEHSVDAVFVVSGRQPLEKIQEVIQICETEGVEAWLLADFFRTRIARAYVDSFQNRPVLVFRSTPDISWALFVKRVMDIVLSAILLVLFAPLMAIIALVIKLTSPGPILFRQVRCTLHGRLFTMYKFRTMVADAERLRPALEAQNELEGPVFKIRNDPRITPVGRFLRRYSLDELPQLFNVLLGHMSLVGPRPPIPSEVEKYENWQRRRLSMRSGITGLWQVSGRNELTFDDWLRLDLEYIDRWSLWLDLWILLKTPLTVLRGTGY